LFFIAKVLGHLTTKAFELTESISYCKCNSPARNGQQVSRICTELFEKWPVAIFCFSKDIDENPGNLLTNRKKEIQIQQRIMNALLVLTSFW
jgi:hypothetical protein